MVKAIHQYVSSIALRDAIGEYAFVLRGAFREMGYESEIFYDSCTDEICDEVVPFKKYGNHRSSENLFLIHYGIKLPYLKPLTLLPDKKILIYHNITPSKFFEDFAPWMIRICNDSRTEMVALKKYVVAAVGDSVYNANELKEAGYENVSSIPLAIDFSKYDVDPDPEILHKYSGDGWVNWLFVGRISPNKKQEDLIKCFYYYQKYINNRSHLILAGQGFGMNSYVEYLTGLTAHLGVCNVVFTGSVSQETLAAYYKTASIFVVMSEHEGFCVPLLEAFYYGVPVVAYDSSAVSETLGGAGILVKEKRHEEIAELVHYLLNDSGLKKEVVEGQKERLKAFQKESILKSWKNLIESVQLKYTVKEPIDNLKKSEVEAQQIVKAIRKDVYTLAKDKLEDKLEEARVDAQKISDDIGSEFYFDDCEGFENRLLHIRKCHELYHLPNIFGVYPLLAVWPLRNIATLISKIFSKLYFWHSSRQQEAFYQLIDEIRRQYTVIHCIYNENSLRSKGDDERKS
tara:strand:+ start:610 stop:2154 length:1545 start_codon:yes stop_codon:yes gene_type:complete